MTIWKALGIDREAFVSQYLRTMLWAETWTPDGQDEPVELHSVYVVDDVADDAREALAVEAGVWLERHADDVRAYLATIVEPGREARQSLRRDGTDLAHDLWLTRRGHGTGFWDRGLGDLGDRLTTAARELSEDVMPYGDGATVRVDGLEVAP